MCDQNEVQYFNCEPCQDCEYTTSTGELIKTSNFCQPEWKQCPTPTRSCESPSKKCEVQYVSYQPEQQTEYVEWQPDQQQSYEQCCVTSSDPCNPCVQRCNPCEPLGPCPMPLEENCQPRYPCPPMDTCSPMCSPYSRRRYIQPARAESCKPVIRYQRPCIPMSEETVYKESFDCIDSKTAASCRMPPVYPVGQLRSPCGDFAKETVMKLSFQRNCCPERTKLINPRQRLSVGQGPMQALTTQMHDFVPKFCYRRAKCSPRDNIKPKCGYVENLTIQRQSFMPPCRVSRVQSCKPIIRYKAPQLPMEFETTQKLSFAPVCPSSKPDMPWARKAKYCPPTIRFAKDTTATLSYSPPGHFLDDKTCGCEVTCDVSPRASC